MHYVSSPKCNDGTTVTMGNNALLTLVTMGNDEPANDDLLRPPVTMGCYALLPKVTMGNERRRNDCLLPRYVREQSQPGLTTPSDNPLSKLTELNETCPPRPEGDKFLSKTELKRALHAQKAISFCQKLN